MNTFSNKPIDSTSLVEIEAARDRLLKAVTNGRSAIWCLRLWSRYIQARDLHRCIRCDATKRLQAHHIVRKTLFPWGAVELGNGITLCNPCHAIFHADFNGRPDLNQPLHAQGGDDQEEWAALFSMLYDDAVARQLDQDRFYFIGDHMCQFFKRCQGYENLYEAMRAGKISRISYAYRVWQSMPEQFYKSFVPQLIRLNCKP